MTRKYEFVSGDEKTIAPGRTIKRIRAVIAIGFGVAPGSLGGYVEHDGQLSHSGDAWVSDDGLIFWAQKVGTGNETLTVYNTKNGDLEVTLGRFRGSVGGFLAASKAKHDDQTHLEYKLLIEVAQSRISRPASR